MIKAEHLRRAVDGLQQQFVVLHRHEALLSRRKFSMPNALSHRLLASSAMPESPASSRKPPCYALSALRQWFSQSRAHRVFVGRKTWLTRALLLWVIGGVSTKHPTPQQLHALSAGDWCEVSPRQSKCDATGEVWGDRPIALAYADVPCNAAKALAHVELAFPVEASAREATPLLTADNATPLTPSQAD
eukprot:5627257-Pleurochrysis_carterae.AAC.1